MKQTFILNPYFQEKITYLNYYKSIHCLTFPKQALIFVCLLYKSFENTVGKGKIARNNKCWFALYNMF